MSIKTKMPNRPNLPIPSDHVEQLDREYEGKSLHSELKKKHKYVL
jgi:hypothetical protein